SVESVILAFLHDLLDDIPFGNREASGPNSFPRTENGSKIRSPRYSIRSGRVCGYARFMMRRLSAVHEVWHDHDPRNHNLDCTPRLSDRDLQVAYDLQSIFREDRN